MTFVTGVEENKQRQEQEQRRNAGILRFAQNDDVKQKQKQKLKPKQEQQSGCGFAEAAGEVEEGEGGGGVAAGVGLGEVSGLGVHLLAEFGVAHDGFAPLAHEVVEFGLFAVVGHPAGGAEGGEGLGGACPYIAGPAVGGMGRTKAGSSWAMEVRGYGAQKDLGLWSWRVQMSSKMALSLAS